MDSAFEKKNRADNFVVSTVEFLVPVGGELIVRVFAGFADNEGGRLQTGIAGFGINIHSGCSRRMGIDSRPVSPRTGRS